jgi:hypothetical protein
VVHNEDYLTYLAISPPDCFAGFCGGIVYSIGMRHNKPGAFLSAVILGTLTANWCGVLVGIYFPGAPAHFGAFFVGCSGLAVIRKYLKKFNMDIFAEDLHD